jgi:predicted neutral ceramidase superfamily lipid hydrolase
MTAKPHARSTGLKLFLPSRREALVIALLGAASLGTALFLRYGIIQNTPLGLACEAGEASLTCKVRLAVILMFVWNVFGWGALAAAAIQLFRPNVLVFGVGLVFALAGLVLYNTGASALAIALLLLSLARPVPEAR